MKKLYVVVSKLVQILQVYCDFYCTGRTFVVPIKAAPLFARNLSVFTDSTDVRNFALM
jgi:hypothetical protein